MIDKLTNMKRIFAFLIMCLVVIAALAQENTRIKVEYTERYQNWTGSNKKEKMMLLADGDKSHYYCPMSLVVDSMLSTPEGTVQFNSMVEAANAAGQRPSLLKPDYPRLRVHFSRNRLSWSALESMVRSGNTGSRRPMEIVRTAGTYSSGRC